MAHNRPQMLIRPDVRFGSKADMTACPRDVRSYPESGHPLRCMIFPTGFPTELLTTGWEMTRLDDW